MSFGSSPSERISDSAIVLLSGGLDSAVALLWALEHFERVDTLTIDYGHNKVELEFRKTMLAGLRTRLPNLAVGLGSDTVLEVSGLFEIAKMPVSKGIRRDLWSKGLGSEAILDRNFIFLSIAYSIAARDETTDLVIGTYGNFAIFPDTAPKVLDSLGNTFSVARGHRITIHRPMESAIDAPHFKIAAWKMALDFGGEDLVEFLRDSTISCWQIDGESAAEWGRGCGRCRNCVSRANSYALFRQRTEDRDQAG
jgi:7-cyano-7-deazaguanine synthase